MRGLGIGDWGLGIGDWAQSPNPNPQSPKSQSHILIKLLKSKKQTIFIFKPFYINRRYIYASIYYFRIGKI